MPSLAAIASATKMFGIFQAPKRCVDSVPSPHDDVTVQRVPAGTRCTVTSSWGDGTLSTHLLGAWNIPNILVALAIAASEGIAWSTLLPCFQDVACIPGRMMYSQYAGGPLVIIDYAHEASCA